MNKYFINAVLAILFLFNSAIHAANYTAGLTGMYLYWKPSWQASYDKAKIDPFLLYGGFASVSFENNWSLSLIALFGSGKGNIVDSGTNELGNYNLSINQNVSRQDLDFVVQRKINPYFSIYAGLKEITLDFGAKDVIYSVNGFEQQNKDTHAKMISYGTGLGLSYSYPVISNHTYVNLNFSGILMRSHYELYVLGPYPDEKYQSDWAYYSYGINSTLTLYHYFKNISTILGIGGRYQILKYNDTTNQSYKLGNEIMYGITLTAMYIF